MPAEPRVTATGNADLGVPSKESVPPVFGAPGSYSGCLGENMHKTPSAATVEMIRSPVGIPTVGRDSNLKLIEFVSDNLRPHGAEVRLTHNERKRKANLFAALGPRGVPGIVLSGHTDVMPVDGQKWSSDPFALIEEDGRLCGRGTSDMKSFVAVVMAVVDESGGKGLKTPVHLAFSYDEEVGCLGAGRLIEELASGPVVGGGRPNADEAHRRAQGHEELSLARYAGSPRIRPMRRTGSTPSRRRPKRS